VVNEKFFPDRESLLAALVEDCEATLKQSLQQNKAATLLVSGGSSPKPLYQQLSRLGLDWSAITVALVDERWVDTGHPASNEAFIRQTLLQHNASAAKFITMKTSDRSAALAQPQCQRRYQQLARPFDLTILGMGLDGHTASLFPEAQGLERALNLENSDICVAIDANKSDVTGEFTERMSLSLSGLLQSRQLHLLITGEEKLAVYRRARVNPDLASMPVSAVLQQQHVPVLVYWAL
jgi:6-phosphogluconolactonase